jgi:probable phosphoglycerate mutase
VIVPALVEMDWGQWEGASLDELRARHGAAFDDNASRGLDFRPPGGESPRDVLARIQRWLHELAQAGEPALAVTHNGVLRALLVAATGWPMTGKPPVKLAAGCVHRFGVERDGRIAVVRCNIPLAPPSGGGAR